MTPIEPPLESLIERLRLEPHPEGGYYRETYRASGSIPGEVLPDGFSGDRAFSTAVYFLLPAGKISRLHRIRSDELWHHYLGGALRVSAILPDGSVREWKLGKDLAAGQTPQCAVPGGSWFGARAAEGSGYALVGCTVAPGFDFADFELGGCEELLVRFPGAKDLIESLT